MMIATKLINLIRYWYAWICCNVIVFLFFIIWTKFINDVSDELKNVLMLNLLINLST